MVTPRIVIAILIGFNILYWNISHRENLPNRRRCWHRTRLNVRYIGKEYSNRHVGPIEFYSNPVHILHRIDPCNLADTYIVLL